MHGITHLGKQAVTQCTRQRLLVAVIAVLSATALPATLAITPGAVYAGSTCAPSETPLPQAQSLKKAITEVMQRWKIPGAAVGLWIPCEGSYTQSFGVGNKHTEIPIRLVDHVRIGSITKTFTGTAILQLADRGKVRLDDPVAKYVSGVPGGERITLRQLLGMRSGLFPYTDDNAFNRSLENDLRRTGGINRAYTPRQLLGYSSTHPLVFSPGSHWQYSNTNTVLLGMVVEKVAGQPLREYLKKHIIDPLRLDHTSYPEGGDLPRPRAHGYTNQTISGATADATFWNPSWGNAAGAMISTMADLKIWARVLATGSLLEQATQAERLKAVKVVPGIKYGLAILNGNGWVGHQGDIPGYSSLALYLPDMKATLVVLTNSDIAQADRAPSAALGQAVTKTVTPKNVYTLPEELPPPVPVSG
ncbi:serine hydrolase domain-containing protein [Streptomyces puniciscabiei]